jgi:hypothetical protein
MSNYNKNTPVIIHGVNMVVLGRFNRNTGDDLHPPSVRLSRTEFKTRISQNQRDRAVELYLSGQSLRAVGRTIGVSRSVVTDALAKAGINLRQ